MADLSDVRAALATLINDAIYPTGTGNPSSTGYTTSTIQQWPNSADQNAQLAANGVIVSVFAETFEKITTRFETLWTSSVVVRPTITADVTSQTVTLGGTITAGHFATIEALNFAASYIALEGDTLSTFATSLALALTMAGLSASASGSVITIPNAAAADIAARAGAPGTAIKEVRRQQKGFRIGIWAPSDEARIATANIIDPLLAATDWIGPFPDTTQGWITSRSSDDIDDNEKRLLFRRDLCYWVEYATTQSMTVYPVTVVQTVIRSEDGSIDGASYTTPITDAPDDGDFRFDFSGSQNSGYISQENP